HAGARGRLPGRPRALGRLRARGRLAGRAARAARWSSRASGRCRRVGRARLSARVPVGSLQSGGHAGGSAGAGGRPACQWRPAAAIESLRSRRPTPLAAATLGAWLLSFSVANEASSVNYFLEVVPLAAASAAVGWTALARRGAERAFLAAGLAVLQMALLFHVPNTVGVWPSFFPPHGYTPTAGDWEVGRDLDAEVVATPGDVLSEPAGFAVRNG